ncbi:alpha-ketoglutarate-dependent dioxygenase AlkB [Gammaproteobacteria bacterium]|nr:alpha-ketoglutarate-dependent dioxygenase AlkB [Gammaproteobacteria bacterium]
MQSLQLPLEPGHSSDVMEKLTLPDAEIFILPEFLSATDADQHYDELLLQTPWRQEQLNFGGKSVPIPRLQAWYGDKNSRYAYSGLALTPLPWTPLLEELKRHIEQCSNSEFNSVLLNYYRTGQDSVAWHSDDEAELGQDPVIASLSLGVTRRFELKHRFRKGIKSFCDLSHGSLVVMGKGVQQNWQHQIPKQPGIDNGRINLTFRKIY